MASQAAGGQFVTVNNPLLSRSEFLQHLRPGLLALASVELGMLPPAALPIVTRDE